MPTTVRCPLFGSQKLPGGLNYMSNCIAVSYSRARILRPWTKEIYEGGVSLTGVSWREWMTGSQGHNFVTAVVLK